MPWAPFASETFVTARVASTVIERGIVELCKTPSVTMAVKGEAPAVVGVPLIMPVAALSESPAGSDPTEIDHANGAMPPVAASGCEYATPTSPCGSDVVDIASAGFTVMDSAAVAVAEVESVTMAVNGDAPAVVGVPIMAPAKLSDRPAGSVPSETDHVYGPVPPVAARACE